MRALFTWGAGAWLSSMGFALLVGACGDDEAPATSEGGGGGAGGTGSGGEPVPFAQSPCGVCVGAECVGLAEACLAEPECAAHLDCVLQCPATPEGAPDAACVASCPAPAGAAAAQALADWNVCAGATSGCAECGHAEPGSNPYEGQVCRPIDLSSPCAVCFYEECCETFTDCFIDNPECDALFVCITECPPSKPYHLCNSDCFAEHPDGVMDYLVDLSCNDVMCGYTEACSGAPVTPCMTCVHEDCATTEAACFENPACFVATHCAGDCNGDATCVAGCLATLTTEELALFEAWRICAQQECFAEC